MTGPARCFLCGARMWEETARRLLFPSGRMRAFRFACGSCGVLADDPALRPEMGFEEGVWRLGEDAAFGADLFTLRMAAAREGWAAEPLDGAQRAGLEAPHSLLAAAALLRPLAEATPAPMALGVLCRPGELPGLMPALKVHEAWADEIAVLVDADSAPKGEWGNVRVAARPLDGDFSAQRNALSAMTGLPWMLQLDADETLAPEAGPFLRAFAGLAERSGTVSVGLPRRNLVGGVLSDVFPDTQYRLNHRSVAYRGRVHERPDRPWQRSAMALFATIDHHLDPLHVARRSVRYEAIEPGGGRLGEAQALLQPFRA